MPGGTVPVNNTWLTEKVPVNKFSLNKQTSKLKTSFRGQFLTIFSSIIISKQSNYKCTNITGFPADISFG